MSILLPGVSPIENFRVEFVLALRVVDDVEEMEVALECVGWF